MAEILEQASKKLNYLIEDERRKTFKKWVFSDKNACNADKMAEAGFIFIGNKIERDAVKCFFCDKCLDGWDATDDPWDEHLKHASQCSFAKLGKPQDCLTVKEFLNVKNELMESIIKSYYEKEAEDINTMFEDREKEIMSVLEKN